MKKLSLILVFFNLTSLMADHIRTEPWLTENAIFFLKGYLAGKPEAVILEFGSGTSTLWFAKQTPNLYSVEHNKKYYELNKKELAKDDYYPVAYYLCPRPYYNICEQFPDDFFDLILVDGRNRKGCIAHSISKLKPGGVLMLDNSERIKYRAVFPLIANWEHHSTKQTRPDQFGYFYSGWRTDWWIKPSTTL